MQNVVKDIPFSVQMTFKTVSSHKLSNNVIMEVSFMWATFSFYLMVL